MAGLFLERPWRDPPSPAALRTNDAAIGFALTPFEAVPTGTTSRVGETIGQDERGRVTDRRHNDINRIADEEEATDDDRDFVPIRTE